MAEDIAREIIAQSKGGSKMAFKISPDQGDPSSSIILSSSNVAATDKYSYSGYDTQKTTFHIHLINNDNTYEVI